MRGRLALGLLAALVLAAALLAPWVARRLYPIHYPDLVFRYAAQHGVSPYLAAAVIQVESRWRPDSTSRKGARGLMQVMPETARWAARQMGLGEVQPADLYDPDLNIRVGTWYLGYLLREFGGSVPLAVAAYNSGPQPVRRWVTEGVWSGDPAAVDRIPFPETRTYVARVLRSYERYLRIYRPEGAARGGMGHTAPDVARG